jgi:dTMP kinase
MRGKFIVFEGGEGSGKDTQIELLKKDHPDWVYTKEPGGTKLGLELRRVLLDWRDGEIDALSELFLFSASRVHFMKDIVRPALDAGKTIVTNRFALSTIAYQVYGRQRPDLLDIAKRATKAAVGDTMPDMTILLDIDPAVGIKRVEARNDGKTKFDAESLAFHQRVRDGYLAHVSDFGPHVVIDAGESVEEVEAQTVSSLSFLEL